MIEENLQVAIDDHTKVVISEALGWKKDETYWYKDGERRALRFQYGGTFGDDIHALDDYPNDMSAASSLVDYMESQGYACVLIAEQGKRCCTFISMNGEEYKKIADTFPHAICQSFIASHGGAI